MGREIVPPLPAGLKKIKRISFKVFLSLKELVNRFKVCDSITPRDYRKKSKPGFKDPVATTRNYEHEYKPSNIINTHNSPYQRWRRVYEWDRYINDPIEKNKRTHNNLI